MLFDQESLRKHKKIKNKKSFFELEEKYFSVNSYVGEKLVFLTKRKNISKYMWLSIRFFILLLDLSVVSITGFVIFKSLSDLNRRIINFKIFWGTIGPTIVLCIIIVLLFITNIILIVYRKKMKYNVYKKAIGEIQQLIIHYNYGIVKMTPEEKYGKINKIFSSAIDKKRLSPMEGWQGSVLGEN